LLLSNQVAFANQINHSNLIARVVLDSSLKPDNSPGVVFASEEELKKSNVPTDAKFGNFLLQMLAGGLITIAAPVAIIIIAVSGLIYVTSHGNQGMIDKAKNGLTYAIVGLVIIIFSWIIVRAVISVVINTNPGGTTTNQATTPAPTGNGAGGQPG
jgi:hypothetical protein